MNDEKLIALIRNGKSDKALQSLYAHYPMMRRLVMSHGGSRADAEDIFQDALVVLCRNAARPDFTLTARLSTYLYGICRFLWKDELRRRARTIPQTLETDDDVPVSEREQQARLAERVINNLGDRCRELLLLFYEAGLKMKEIAERMGYSSENTVKNQKYKCIETAKLSLKRLMP